MLLMNDNLLEVNDLVLKRGKFVMDHISFEVKDKEIVAIIGKNGAGKTLLLESIAGLQKLDGGRIKLYKDDGQNYLLHMRNIGYLYQEYCLFPHMSAKSNIAYGLKMQGKDKKYIEEKVLSIAKEFEIDHILDQYPYTLSGGQKQRVALARALVTRPRLLLLDEPFAALDPVTRSKLYQMVKKIRDEYGCAIIFVTHDFNEAINIANRVGVLIDGKLKGMVDNDKLFTHEWDDVTKKFLGVEV